MPLDSKTFEFDVLGCQNSNLKILTSWAICQVWLDAKSFDLGWAPGLEVWRSKDIQIEAFSIQWHDPRMLKASNSRSWGSKISNLKVQTFWSYAPGW